MSLAVVSLENLLTFTLIAESLDWRCISITSTSIEIDLEKWGEILDKKKKLNQLRIQKLFNKLETYLNITDQCDIQTSRWLSHGHIGFNFMFAVYGKCLYETASLDQRKNHIKEAEKVNKNKDTRFHTLANAWIRSQPIEFQSNETHDFPIKCFWILVNNCQ